MDVYDIYGFKSEEIEEVRDTFEESSGVTLELRISSYLGGTYYLKGNGNEENFILRRNYSDEEGWAEEEYKELGVILYVSRSQRADELRELLLRSLEHEILFIERIVITEDRRYQKYKYVDGKEQLLFERRAAK